MTAYTLALAFGLAGIVQLTGAPIVRRAYLRWGYPERTFRLLGAVELLAAVLLVTPTGRLIGIVLGAGINFLAVVLLLKNRAYWMALPGIVAMAVLPLTLAPTY
jgi:hypothetical protein